MARNLIFKPGWQFDVVVTDPAAPVSGNAVRFGSLTGVALLDEGDGGVGATETVVDFGPGVWDLPVTAEAGAISVGDALFYDDAISALNNDSANGYFFGFALEAIAAGTETINVFHAPSPGAGTLGAGTVGAANLAANAVTATKIAANAVTTAKISDGNVTEAKLAAVSLTGLVAALVADANVIGGIPVLHRIAIPDASGNIDVVFTHKTQIIAVVFIATGAAGHATDDHVKVTNVTAGQDVTEEISKTATVNSCKFAQTILAGGATVAAGATVRATAVKVTNVAGQLYILGFRVA